MFDRLACSKAVRFSCLLWIASCAGNLAHAGEIDTSPPVWLVAPGFTPGYNAPSNDDIFDEHLLSQDLVKDRNYLATTVNLVLHHALKKYRANDQADEGAYANATDDNHSHGNLSSYGMRISSDKLMFKAKYRF